jgi:hypothetical protein
MERSVAIIAGVRHGLKGITAEAAGSAGLDSTGSLVKDPRMAA